MRRYGFLIFFALILVLPLALRQVLTRRGESGDAKTSAMKLVVVTPHMQDIRREFARAFAQWHQKTYGQSAEIVYLTPGGTNDIKRQLETTYRSALDKTGHLPANFQPDMDVVWGGGDFFYYAELRPLGVLQPILIDPNLLKAAFPEPTLAGVALYDRADTSPPQWIGVCLSSFGIVYNPDLYRTLQLQEPKAWGDLTSEKLSGLIALADPTHSGSAAIAYNMVLQRAMADAEDEFRTSHPGAIAADDPAYQAALARGWKRGMGQLLLIAANARYFTDSASQVPSDVGNGEAAAGMAIDFYGRVYQESVGADRCKFVSPFAATAINPDAVGILRGVKGERLTLATRFVEFLLTPEAQRLWILKPGQPGGPLDRSLRRPPIRRDMYADRTGWADDVDLFAEAGNFNQRSEWMTLFGDTRPLWAAAWIDSREALKNAYAKILAVRDPARRAALIAELANLPIEMKDVAELRSQRKKLEKEQGNVEEFKAMQRIEWAKRFRAHYASIAAKAG